MTADGGGRTAPGRGAGAGQRVAGEEGRRGRRYFVPPADREKELKKPTGEKGAPRRGRAPPGTVPAAAAPRPFAPVPPRRRRWGPAPPPGRERGEPGAAPGGARGPCPAEPGAARAPGRRYGRAADTNEREGPPPPPPPLRTCRS